MTRTDVHLEVTLRQRFHDWRWCGLRTQCHKGKEDDSECRVHPGGML